jgi:hypothetical protein
VSQGIEILNHPTGRTVYVSRRNAERMVRFGVAECIEGRIRLTPLFWEEENRRHLALKRRRNFTAKAYDDINRLLSEEELSNIPLLMPGRAINRGYAGKPSMCAKAKPGPRGKSGPGRAIIERSET